MPSVEEIFDRSDLPFLFQGAPSADRVTMVQRFSHQLCTSVRSGEFPPSSLRSCLCLRHLLFDGGVVSVLEIVSRMYAVEFRQWTYIGIAFHVTFNLVVPFTRPDSILAVLDPN